MRDLSAALQDHLNARPGLIADLLIVAQGVNKTTSTTETAGFWTGPTDMSIDISGSAQSFVGSGAIVTIPAIVSEIGLQVRTLRFTLSTHPEVVAAVDLYDLRLKPISLYVAYSRGVSGNFVDAPVGIFDGVVAGQPSSRPEPGGAAALEFELLSKAHHLTQTLTLRKSSAALQQRHPGDMFRRYIDVSGAVEVVWGTVKSAAPSNSAPPSDTTTTNTVPWGDLR